MLLPANLLTSLQAPLQTLATNFFQAAKDSLGIDLVMIAGLRSLADQHALYEQGRTTPGPIVTNADAGHSWHNWGYAFDVGIQDPDTGATTLPDASDPRWQQLGDLAASLGLTWGGTFSGLADFDHFEWHPGLTLSAVADYFKQTGEVLLAALPTLPGSGTLTPLDTQTTILLLALASLLGAYLYFKT